ncbi:hypothetical protein [Streptomyces sp. NPDC052225]|uniref:hypothetical protein n=1 Tax=Streptomyces sp. NPDC052225 TaxID=3154949 RepID=UPI003424D5BF
MSTTPQIGQQQQQQPYGQQQPFGQQGQQGRQQGLQPIPRNAQQGQQQDIQGPSTMPPQFGQQSGQQLPQHLQQQLQQMGQQQPFQQLLHQMGQPGQQSGQQQSGRQSEVPQAEVPEVSTRALVTGVAQNFFDYVQPLPGQAELLYLFVDNAWRVLVNPVDETHQMVQQAFAYGQQVIAFYDSAANPGLIVGVAITR